MLYALQNLIFMKILLFYAIERRTFTLGLTAFDVIREFSSLESVQLNDGSHGQRLSGTEHPFMADAHTCTHGLLPGMI